MKATRRLWQCQKTMIWFDKWGAIIVLHVQLILIYISLTARINDRKFRKGLFSSEVLASVAVVANLVNSIIGTWIWNYCVLACRTALLERMPVFETKASEQIPNGEVPTQQEPQTVTKEGTFGLLSFKCHMNCGIKKGTRLWNTFYESATRQKTLANRWGAGCVTVVFRSSLVEKRNFGFWFKTNNIPYK